MSWAQNVLGTESLIWAQNVQAQNRRLKIAGTESLGTKSGTFLFPNLGEQLSKASRNLRKTDHFTHQKHKKGVYCDKRSRYSKNASGPE